MRISTPAPEEFIKQEWRKLHVVDPNTTATAASPSWQEKLLRNQKGCIRALLANAVLPLREANEWKGVLRFNEFTGNAETSRTTVWGKPTGTAWNDNDDRLFAEWLQHQGILIGTEVAGQAVQTVAQEVRHHPVREYLRSLTWDGKPRLDWWVVSYLGVDREKEISRTFGRLWLISAVARVMRPGCKADCCPILEGPQGKFKSTALRVLAGDWFTDQISEPGSKDAAMQCHGVWIVELAELDAISRATASRIKGFMSATFDRIRLPYAKHVTEWPRDCVFSGSVNHGEYLRDETGARRFWPLRCGSINIELLARDRDQLWAEAVSRYDAGDVWWLQDDLSLKAAEAEQAERYQTGAWDGLIADWLTAPQERYDGQGHPIAAMTSDRDSVTIADILSHAIGKPQQFWTRADEMNISAALKSLGWERFRQRVGNKLGWRYRRAEVRA